MLTTLCKPVVGKLAPPKMIGEQKMENNLVHNQILQFQTCGLASSYMSCRNEYFRYVFIVNVSFSTIDERITVVDLHSKIFDAPTPVHFFSIFMQFLANFGRIIG